MSEIEFNEEKYIPTRNVSSGTPSPGITRWFAEKALRLGIIRTESQADYLLLGIAIIAIILTLTIPSFVGPEKPPTTPLQFFNDK